MADLLPYQFMFAGARGQQSPLYGSSFEEGSPAYIPSPVKSAPYSPAPLSSVADPGAVSLPNLGDYYASGFNPSAGETQSKAANVLGAVSGVSAWLPGVGSVISGLSAAGSLIMNWWAAGKQMDAQKEAQKQAQQAYAEQMAESKRRYDIETQLKQKELKEQQQEFLTKSNLATRQQAHAEEMDTATLKANAEQKYWDRYLSLIQNMTNMMSTPGSRAGIAQLYKR